MLTLFLAAAISFQPPAVPISFEIDRDTFPAAWKAKPDNVRGAPLDESERDRTLRAVRRGMEKYPADLLKKHLERVHLLGDLEFAGISAAGTNSRTKVYVRSGAVSEGYTSRYVEETFHHEFSSILLRNAWDKFPHKEWRSQNPSGFKYGASGVDAVRAGRASQRFSAELHAKGFLHEYATGDFEDDFNSFAENLFTGKEEFWRATTRYDKLKRKAELAAEFYAGFDPSLNEAYFRSLAQPRPAAKPATAAPNKPAGPSPR